MRIVYFGSSDFSLPGLRACLELPEYAVVGVITTPPQKQGRGLELTPTIVAKFCADQKINYAEFAKLDTDAFCHAEKWRPDILVVSSYGKMIPDNFLGLAKIRFNIHPSLLPKYRGASPLNGPILAGDFKTGLSIADVTKELDAGDLYYQEEILLTPTSDSEEMGRILSEKSYMVLKNLLVNARMGSLSKTPQRHQDSCYAPKLSKKDGRLHFSDPAVKWDRLVRGLKPWPGAFAEIHAERVNVISVLAQNSEVGAERGKIVRITDSSLLIQTSDGVIELIRVKPAGKNEMSGADYARGRRWQVGMKLI